MNLYFIRRLLLVIVPLLLMSLPLSKTFADTPLSALDINPIKIGEKIPNIILNDTEGKPFDLNRSLKKKPAVIIFYRGSWCPYCNTHLGKLNKIENDILKLGYQIIAISPDLPEYLKESTAENELNYSLYSDSKMQAAQALGLAYKVDDKTLKKLDRYNINLEKNSGESHHLLPVPAALLVDKKGKVRFSFVAPDYKTRIDSDLLIKAAEVYK